MQFLIQELKEPYKADVIAISILPKRKLRLRKVDNLTTSV